MWAEEASLDGSSARLSWIMFHLPCSPPYHGFREGVEGSHPIAAPVAEIMVGMNPTGR